MIDRIAFYLSVFHAVDLDQFAAWLEIKQPQQVVLADILTQRKYRRGLDGLWRERRTIGISELSAKPPATASRLPVVYRRRRPKTADGGLWTPDQLAKFQSPA